MKKSLKNRVFFLSFLFTVLLFAGCLSANKRNSDTVTKADAASANSGAETFDAWNTLTREMFMDYAGKDTLTLNYTLKNPSDYDILLDEVTWGDVPITDDDFKSCKNNTKDYLDRLRSITPLNKDQALTYDVLNYYLELELEGYDYAYFTDNFSSMKGIQSQFPMTMAEYAFDHIQDVEDYLNLLNCFDLYVEQLLAFENEKALAGYGMCVSELLTSIEECRAFCESSDTNMLIDIFPSKLEHLNLSESETRAYIQANETAIFHHVLPAYKNIIDTLTAQLSTAPDEGALASYENGSDYYVYLLKSSVGTDKTPEELIAQTESKILSSMTALSLLLAKNENLPSAISRETYLFNDPEAILEHFHHTLVKEQFPEGPSVTYTLKNVHTSLSDILSPAMYFIPRIDDIENNQIYLNLQNTNSGNELMPTLAHEGYPGHMYQTTYYYHTHPDPIRTVYESNGYMEGWASYVESLSYDYCGFSEDVANFNRISNLILSLNLYCRLDLGIHYENWSFEDMADYTAQYLKLDHASLKQIYDMILYNPTNYLVYGIGMNEIVELRNSMKKNLGSHFDAKIFHKQLLDIGPAPFPIIDKYMPDASLLSSDSVNAYTTVNTRCGRVS